MTKHNQKPPMGSFAGFEQTPSGQAAGMRGFGTPANRTDGFQSAQGYDSPGMPNWQAADKIDELAGQIYNNGVLTNNAPYFAQKAHELKAVAANLRKGTETK